MGFILKITSASVFGGFAKIDKDLLKPCSETRKCDELKMIMSKFDPKE